MHWLYYTLTAQSPFHRSQARGIRNNDNDNDEASKHFYFSFTFFFFFFNLFFLLHINADNAEHGDGSRISNWSDHWNVSCSLLHGGKYQCQWHYAKTYFFFFNEYFSSFALPLLSNPRTDHHSFLPFSRSLLAYIYVFIRIYVYV